MLFRICNDSPSLSALLHLKLHMEYICKGKVQLRIKGNHFVKEEY